MPSRSLTVHCSAVERASMETGRHLDLGADIHIHFATLTSLVPLTEHYRDLLDAAELARLERFKFEVDEQRFLLGHGFLREVLGRYMERAARSVGFERGPYGKPVVPGASFHFNLSDTKDAVAVAICANMELGVDVETVDRNVDHINVGQHYFTVEEQASIVEADDGKRRFLEFWTRKEAVLKASGVGIMDDLRVLRVDQAENRMMITHDVFIAMAAPEYHVRTWAVDATHIVSLATPQRTTGIKFFGVPG